MPFHTPCKLAYIKPCLCYQLQAYIDLNPQGPDGFRLKGESRPWRADIPRLKGSLDSLQYSGEGPLSVQYLDHGEVVVSPDGLLHPHTAFKLPPGSDDLPPYTNRFVRYKPGPYFDLMVNSTWDWPNPEFPASYVKLEQHHIWMIPMGTPMPEGVYLETESGFRDGDRDSELNFFNLRIEKPMTLRALNVALDSMLAKYARVGRLSTWYNDKDKVR